MILARYKHNITNTNEEITSRLCKVDLIHDGQLTQAMRNDMHERIRG